MLNNHGQDHPYSSVDSHDLDHDDRHDDSSTDVETLDIGLADEEKLWHEDPHHGLGKTGCHGRRRSIKERVRVGFEKWRGVVEFVLLVMILALGVRQWMKEGSGGRNGEWDFGGDMTGFGPRFSQQITTFHPDQSYAPNDTSKFFKQETLDKWTELMPKGMGFQWVKDPSKYNNLPTPVDWTEGKTVFTTSVTHQLHCLWAIVQTYSGITSNISIPSDHHWHMIHCFDYLRQAIMCSADTALEGHEFTFPDHNGGSDGWDAKHVCKDYSQVKKYLESVRAYDDQQIY